MSARDLRTMASTCARSLLVMVEQAEALDIRFNGEAHRVSKERMAPRTLRYGEGYGGSLFRIFGIMDQKGRPARQKRGVFLEAAPAAVNVTQFIVGQENERFAVSRTGTLGRRFSGDSAVSDNPHAAHGKGARGLVHENAAGLDVVVAHLERGNTLFRGNPPSTALNDGFMRRGPAQGQFYRA